MIHLGEMKQVTVDAAARRAVCGGGATWADLDAATQQHGFDHPGLQLKWLDYKAGWLAGRKSNIGHTEKPI